MLITEFLDVSPSPHHAVAAAITRLTEAGYQPLREADAWLVQPGGKYYFSRGGRSLVAWRMGEKPPAESGFHILVGHTDSPVLRVKPNGALGKDNNWLAIEVYGSPILHTWLDRDLKAAGVVYALDDAGVLEKRLVDLDGLLLRAVSLAPHLKLLPGPEFKIDPANDLAVVLGGAKSWRDAVADAAGLDPARIKGFDLNLTDAQKAAYVGVDKDFISSPRLDNLGSCYCGLSALTGLDAPTAATALLCLYDAEEIGSLTWEGARSNLLLSVLQRLSGDGSEALARASARSLVVSADMAHAMHPAFASASDPHNVPALNKGLALKSGALGNYAVDRGSEAWFTAVCEDENVPLQSFTYRVGHRGGSSVGPLVSGAMGLRGIDVGAPMLAMHSIRELAGAADVDLSTRAFGAFFRSTRPVEPAAH